MKHISIFILCISPYLILPNPQANDWKLKKTSDGIEVFTRSSELSDLDEFKGIGNINAPLEQIIKVFQNADQMSYWSPNCEESRLMERQGNVQIHYTISGAPFPIQDRDAFTQFKYIPQDNGMKIEISAIPFGGHVGVFSSGRGGYFNGLQINQA